jgi:hypothetical protein
MSEKSSYLIRIDKELYYNFKSKLNKAVSINDVIVKLIQDFVNGGYLKHSIPQGLLEKFVNYCKKEDKLPEEVLTRLIELWVSKRESQTQTGENKNGG